MKFLVGLLITCQTAMAAFPIVDVQNISGDYLDGKGVAYAQKATYKLPKVKISHEHIDLKFSKVDKRLVISDPSTTVELEFDFSFLNVFKAFSFNNLDINSTDKLFTIYSESLDLYIDPKKYHLEEFKVETDIRNIPTQDDEDITILDGLILNAGLETKKLTFDQFDDVIFDDLRSENPDQVAKINDFEMKSQALEVPMIVRGIKLDVENGIFNGKALIDSYINLWLRIGGNITSNKTNTKIDIRLTKAKLGVFSIRGTLLGMVKRLNLDGVTVNGNIIHVDLKTVSSRNQTKP